MFKIKKIYNISILIMAPSQYIKLQQVINVSEFVSLKKTRGSINIGYLDQMV